MIVTFTHLTGANKGKLEKWETDRVTVGRASDNKLSFGDDQRRVSSHHAEVRRDGDRWLLFDLGSTNGTMINGRRVITAELKNDDLVEIGAGGPLLRFGTEPADAADRKGGAGANQSQAPPSQLGESTVELIVDRAVRHRANNLGLIAAIVGAMIIGAAGGMLLSSRSNADARHTMSFSAVAERNSPSVVYIRTEFELLDEDNRVLASEARAGSGFIVSSAGLILTNRHVVRDWEYNDPGHGITGRIKRIDVIFPGQRREDATPAEVFRLSSGTDTDLALLKIRPKSDLPVIGGLRHRINISQGDEVAVIGFPLGLDLMRLTGEDRIATHLFVGVVSHIAEDHVQLNLRAYNGNSGGPVLNLRGEVIGVLTANVGAAQDITLCTPISKAFELLEGESNGS